MRSAYTALKAVLVLLAALHLTGCLRCAEVLMQHEQMEQPEQPKIAAPDVTEEEVAELPEAPPSSRDDNPEIPTSAAETPSSAAEDEEETYRLHRAAFDAYWKCIESRDRSFLAAVPEDVRLHYGGHRNLRQDASDYLDDAEGGVVVLNGLHIIQLSPNAEIDNPVRLRFWHNTSHYAGAKLLLVDKDGSILASYSPPEVSSFNEVLRPLEAEIPYRKPKSTEGFIVSVKWDSKNGEQALEQGQRIPVRFRVSP